MPGRHEKSSNPFSTLNIIYLQSLSEPTRSHKCFAIEIEEKLKDTKKSNNPIIQLNNQNVGSSMVSMIHDCLDSTIMYTVKREIVV